jgi:hypothetical protein
LSGESDDESEDDSNVIEEENESDDSLSDEDDWIGSDEPTDEADREQFDASLGPDWKNEANLRGALPSSIECRLQVLRNTSLKQIRTSCKSSEVPQSTGNGDERDATTRHPIEVQVDSTSIDRWIGVDLIVCAYGVRPNLTAFGDATLLKASDGGVWTDDRLCTSLRHVYAAGDCATVLNVVDHSNRKRQALREQLHRLRRQMKPTDDVLNVSLADRPVRSKRWLQMRLWSQALQTGRFAAHSLACDLLNEPAELYACFDLFAHVTRFFDCKVVMLGRHDVRLLSIRSKPEVWLRVQDGRFLIKLIFDRNRLQGALLLGETDLEETIENLLYSQLNLRHLKRKLLLDNFDLEDFFD